MVPPHGQVWIRLVKLCPQQQGATPWLARGFWWTEDPVSAALPAHAGFASLTHTCVPTADQLPSRGLTGNNMCGATQQSIRSMHGVCLHTGSGGPSPRSQAHVSPGTPQVSPGTARTACRACINDISWLSSECCGTARAMACMRSPVCGLSAVHAPPLGSPVKAAQRPPPVLPRSPPSRCQGFCYNP